METLTPAHRPAGQATWLELVRASRETSRKIELHPIQEAPGCPMALTLGSRLLCSNDGRITIFENLGAAMRFLSVAGIRDWDLGHALSGIGKLLPGAEQLRLRGGRLSA